MSELTDFLEARLAEDADVARAATADGGEWFCRYPEMPDCHMAGEFGWTVSGPGVETEDTEWGKHVADHIARHDPARVLVEVEAKRAIVALHQSRGEPDLCAVCSEWADGWPCKTLRLLALPYADHEDYQEGWAL